MEQGKGLGGGPAGLVCNCIDHRTGACRGALRVDEVAQVGDYKARVLAPGQVFRFCSGMSQIGQTHARDFGLHRQQVPLAELQADPEGFVRFCCKVCPHTGKIALVDLRARFAPDAGLVNILNAIRPHDCPGAGLDFQGFNRCGIHYRDLGGPNG